MSCHVPRDMLAYVSFFCPFLQVFQTRCVAGKTEYRTPALMRYAIQQFYHVFSERYAYVALAAASLCLLLSETDKHILHVDVMPVQKAYVAKADSGVQTKDESFPDVFIFVSIMCCGQLDYFFLTQYLFYKTVSARAASYVPAWINTDDTGFKCVLCRFLESGPCA